MIGNEDAVKLLMFSPYSFERDLQFKVLQVLYPDVEESAHKSRIINYLVKIESTGEVFTARRQSLPNEIVLPEDFFMPLHI